MMNDLGLMLSVIDRRSTQKFIEFYETNGVKVQFVSSGRGTASSDIMDILGFDTTEKTLLYSLISAESWKKVLRKLRSTMRIDVPGMGIVAVIPVSTVGGLKQLSFLTAMQELEKGDISKLKDTKYELVAVIAEQGYSDLIMDAAKKAGAGGGTVIHARGTGLEQAEKLLGVTLAKEKEMIIIVVRTSERSPVMKAVMDRAGLNSPAKAIVFSLPVTDTAGMRLMEDDFEEAGAIGEVQK